MDVMRIAAFSDGNSGGNPAGVAIAESLPPSQQMQAVAQDVGFSETAFAAPDGKDWIVRYFSPKMEVPFCGHATIALGAALAMKHGDGVFQLELAETEISVEGRKQGTLYGGALQSPPTQSRPAAEGVIAEALELFGYSRSQLDPRLSPAMVKGGASHLLIALQDRGALAAMSYDQAAGQAFMSKLGLVTVSLVHAESDQVFHARNPFAAGGVYEDPATGAAAAALAGYLRDAGWPHHNVIDIIQGEDMGMRSLLNAEFTDEPGSSVRVSGTARLM